MTPTEIAWPARAALSASAVAGPGDTPVLNRHPWVDRATTPWIATRREEPVRVRWACEAGVGVIRAIESAGGDRAATGNAPPSIETGGIADLADADAVERLVFVSSWTHETAESVAAFVEDAGGAEWPKPEPEVTIDHHWGVRMRYRPAAAGVPARGVVVHLHGLGGHGFERSAQRPLLADGWGVLECVYPLANWSRMAADVADPASVADLGGRLAHIIDNRFGELAFAAEAAIEALAARGDAAANAGPVVIASFSAGGNAAPAVAARLGDRVRGLAIVVGGADLMRISVSSGLRDTGFDARRAGQPIGRRRLARRELDALSEAYLDRVHLDGAAIAPRLRHLPTLVVLGRFDTIVPTATGRALRTGLGAAATWWVPSGHVGVYLSLPWLGPRIGRWLLRRHAAGSDAG